MRSSDSDKMVHVGLLSIALVSLFALALVFIFLFWNSIQAFTEIGLFTMLTGTQWNPTSMVEPTYGILPLFVATFMVSMIAAVIAIPIGIGCTIYISEIAHPKVKGILKPAIELLAGIPSVIYGLFALLILSGWIKSAFGLTTGWNALNGGIMLAVMMIPIMVSLSEDALNSVPKELKEASLALGATRWETMRRVMIPSALSGIVAAIILSIGRAVGETMTVLMATGNTPILTLDVFSSVQTMTATIAIEMGEVQQGGIHYSALFAIGVVLFVITLVVNTIADIIMLKYGEAYR